MRRVFSPLWSWILLHTYPRSFSFSSQMELFLKSFFIRYTGFLGDFLISQNWINCTWWACCQSSNSFGSEMVLQRQTKRKKKKTETSCTKSFFLTFWCFQFYVHLGCWLYKRLEISLDNCLCLYRFVWEHLSHWVCTKVCVFLWLVYHSYLSA